MTQNHISQILTAAAATVDAAVVAAHTPAISNVLFQKSAELAKIALDEMQVHESTTAETFLSDIFSSTEKIYDIADKARNAELLEAISDFRAKIVQANIAIADFEYERHFLLQQIRILEQRGLSKNAPV